MDEIYLCGHTGSHNRGCEAIVRSTVKILKESGFEKYRLLSYATEQDKKRGLDKLINIQPYRYSPKLIRGLYKYVLRDPIKVHTEAYRRIVKKDKPSCMVCVGGDTYCFKHYYGNCAINTTGEHFGIPTVLWGCSIDKNILTDKMLKQDIRKYRHIVARESLTYDILRQCVTPEQTLWLACDPAFHLEMKETELPAVFSSGDTVGINLSPYFIKDRDLGNEMIRKNVLSLIRYLLDQTNYNICFIPHVYTVENYDQDLAVLDWFYKQYRDNPRVGFLTEDFSCTEIKYVISKCRFFIGARTHSMIAAYSTGVPALALSYSIKSLGIAKDIFGTCDGYVLSKAYMAKRDCLTEVFTNHILNREEEICARYRFVMPAYKESILSATKTIFSEEMRGLE